MKTPPVLPWWLAALLLAATIPAEAALSAGGSAYTKRYKTTLLAEPSPQAKPAGELPFATKVKIEQAKGNWLRVNGGSATGWVFMGSLSETKPDEDKGLDGVPLLASNTTATAAARPLTEAAEEYSQRRNLGSASGDLNWMLGACDKITPQQVQAFMQQNKRGEYQ